jgi:hypothetical protein
VSINVWRLAGDTLNITCNFLYCNHQVHRDFLITLYNVTTFVPFSQLPGDHFVFRHTQKKKLAHVVLLAVSREYVTFRPH